MDLAHDIVQLANDRIINNSDDLQNTGSMFVMIMVGNSFPYIRAGVSLTL